MKNLLLLSFLACLAMGICLPVEGAAPEKPVRSKTADDYLIQEGPLAGLTVQEAMTMKPREIKEVTGRRFKFGERMGLKMLQRKYRKAKERGEEFAPEAFEDNLFGFIGLIIAGFGLLFGWLTWPVAVAFGVAGIVLGIIGLNKDADPLWSKLSIGIGGAAILLGILVAII